MQTIKRAVRAVVPVWVSVCVIALICAWTLQALPVVMEGAQYYPRTWAANLAHYDPHAYLLIAEQGYGAEGGAFQSSVRFPLFPFLTRIGMQIGQLDGYVVMFLLSKAALLTLAFTAQAPFTGVLPSVFLEVGTETVTPTVPFDPFAGARFVEIANANPVFEVQIDTAHLPTSQIRIECARFVLVLVNDEWKRGTDCTFPEGIEQILLPDERLTVRVTFAGYNLTDPAQFAELIYRRREDALMLRSVLWTGE